MEHCTHGPAACASQPRAGHLLSWAQWLLAQAGVPVPVREARRLWEEATGEAYWRYAPEARVAPGRVAHYRRLVRARARRVPLAYLLGSVQFMDFELRVRPGVFVPRPETEELAELACSRLQTMPPRPRVVDLGTGSGALACAVARARQDAQILAVDRSPRALICARRNIDRLGLASRVTLKRSDWWSSIGGRFHLAVSNPPYISEPELRGLEPEVRVHEPPAALRSGADGLEALRNILHELPSHLYPGGQAYIEIGHLQGEAALALAKDAPGLVESVVHKDMGGRARILAIRWT